MRRLFPLLALVLLAGCGGVSSSSTSSPATTSETTTTSANTAAAAAVFPAKATERATVVLYHGWTDLEPDDYLIWIEHLNSEGVTVIFPRYQQSVLSSPDQMLTDAETATRDGFEKAPPPLATRLAAAMQSSTAPTLQPGRCPRPRRSTSSSRPSRRSYPNHSARCRPRRQ